MTPEDLLAAIQSELGVAGIGRKPGVAGPAAAAPYPVFVSPREGAPKPGDPKGVEANSAAVISIFHSGGIPPDADEGTVRRRLTVDFWIRANYAQTAFEIDGQIDARFIGLTKRGYSIGTGGDARTLISSEKWRELAPLESSKEAGFVFISSYLYECYRA